MKGAVENKLANIPGAEAVQKLLKKGDFRQLEKFKKSFPDAFEELRGGAVDDLISRASTQDGKVSIGRLTTMLRKMPVESQNLIFGVNKKNKIDALQKIMEETQATVRNNPSRLRDILVNVLNPMSLKAATVGQIGNFFRARIVGAPETLKSVGRAAEKSGKFFGAPAGVGVSTFGARQTFLTPKDEGPFSAPGSNSGFGLPRR